MIHALNETLMKTLKMILFIFSALLSTELSAQTKVTTTLMMNKKNNCLLRYYYYPNLQAYFDNLKKVYLFKKDNEWLEAENLPEHYGGYSMYNNYRVLIEDYDGDTPQEFLKHHKKLYPYNSKGRFINATASND